MALKLSLYLIFINLITFALFFLDKRAAVRGVYRISESILLSFVLFGGSLAAIFASHFFRHKNRKTSFRIRMYGLIIAQILGGYYLVVNYDKISVF